MKIIFVKPVSRFAIEVGFDDGEHGIVDLADIAARGVFSQWLKEGVFESQISSQASLTWEKIGLITKYECNRGNC